MCNSKCNCGCSNASSCRNGERILVNNSGCGCGTNRSRCSCANTYRPGCGCSSSCGNRRDNCGCNRENIGCSRDNCGCSRPRPCPPKPSCEDRCRMQYRQCMRNCHLREEERNEGCGCARECGFEESEYCEE